MPSRSKGSPVGVTGRRAWRMAAMGAGVAGSYLGYLVQSAFLNKEARSAKLKSSHQRAASRMRDEMLELRGPIMKLGQALSLQDGILPDEAVEALTALQMRAPGMHAPLVRAQIEGSLGRPPEAIFAKFDPEPFAAASLGQVHHAVTRDGRRVVVKVQYPGIRDAIANDFKWLRTVAKPAEATGHLPRAAVDELETGILAETDYHREADNIERFHSGLTPLPFVSVPRVLREFSSDRVVTMTPVTGQHITELLAGRPSQKLRDLIGARLLELYYFQLLRMHALHADPHWGNYLFTDDGRIGLVDFGCVKYFNASFVKNMQRVFLFKGSHASPEFQRLLEERYAGMGATLSPAVKRALTSLASKFYGKVYPGDEGDRPTPFDFGDPEFLPAFFRASEALVRSKGIRPEYIFMGRAELGMHQTLHKLRARVATSPILRRCMV